MASGGLLQRDAVWLRLIELAAISLVLTAPLAAQSELDFPIEAYEGLEEPEDMLVPPVDFDFKDAFAQIRDPAIETVDELSRNPAAGSGRTVSPGDESFGRRVQDRWDRVQDPAITTVDQLTRDKGGKKEKRTRRRKRRRMSGTTN